MRTIAEIQEMQSQARKWREEGETIVFVPTMGFLHEGHLQLLRAGKKKGTRLVMSIFVNPTQFGPSEDYAQYPRDMGGDLDKARAEGVDVVFIPTVQGMYPEGFQTTVRVEEVTKYLCGKSRPGHFQGVTIVVTKLFNITKPHVAIFGKKDYQQLVVIRRVSADLNMDIEIVGVPTAREKDGLAMSSRNNYLSPDERRSALSLKNGLELAKRMISQGVKDACQIRQSVEDLVLGHPYTEIDYVSVCDPETLEEMDTIDRPCLLALAVRVGNTRLIDNTILEVR